MKALRLLALLLLAPCAAFAATSAKPNIVLIFIDDMGYADIGPFGNKTLRTPHLNKLASEGMKFTSFYATPVCSMSRACLMTGCYNARVSIPGVLFPQNTIGLHSSEVTLPEILKPFGYATMMIGKWHLGHYPEFLPTRQGFDHYFGLPYSNDMKASRKGNPPLPLYRDEKIIETEPDQSLLTKRYTEEAVKFIRDNKTQPFFLYLPHTMIHNPVAASEAFAGKSTDGLLGDAVEEIDWSVGQIMATLKELHLDENTLVIFTSDNGPAGRDAPPFRGNKGTNLEGGVREPCIMRWTGKIPAGTTCNQIAGNIDMLPTFAALTGGTTPSDRVIDGRDISSLMLTANAPAVRDTHLYFKGFALEAIRIGQWKLHLKSSTEAHKALQAKNKKTAETGPALYDVVSDLSESHNVASEHPDIVARLQNEAASRLAELEAHKRPAGQHEGPTTTAPRNQNKKSANDLSKLKLGDHLAKAAAPQIDGKAFTYTFTLQGDQTDAIVLAHGGLNVGYALHVKSGHVVFSVRHAIDKNTDLTSVDPLPATPTRIVASFNQLNGTMSLQVGDQKAVTTKSPGTLKQPAEDFCLGYDSLKPAANYSVPNPYQGKITELNVTVD